MNIYDTAMPGGGEIQMVQAETPDRQKEAEIVNMWLERVKNIMELDKKFFENCTKWERILAGDSTSEGIRGAQAGADKATVRAVAEPTQDANLIFSYYSASIPHIDSKTNIVLSPSRSVDDMHYELGKGFARTSDIVLRRRFVQDAELQERGGEIIRSTVAQSIGWGKLHYVVDFVNDPVFKHRQEDMQDELVRIQQLMQELSEETDPMKKYLLASDIKSLRDSLLSEVQVVSKAGLALDRVSATDVYVSPEVNDILADWQKAEHIIQGIYMTPQAASEMFQLTKSERENLREFSIGEAQKGKRSPPKTKDNKFTGQKTSGKGYVRVYECWNRMALNVTTVIDGLDRLPKPIFQPEYRPASWYPFYPLGFHHVPGRRYPLSDIEQLLPYQKEYNETLAKYMAHRAATIPKTAVKANALQPNEADTYVKAPVGATVPLEGHGDPGDPIQNAFFVPAYAQLDPNLYETRSITTAMERQTGLGDANVGVVSKSKTATEARQIAQGIRGRMGERSKAVVRWKTMMAKDALEILLQVLSLEDVQRIAGIGAVWPALDRKAIDDLVTLDITHRTEADEEVKRLAFAEIAPQILQIIPQIYELRLSNLEPLAASIAEVMQELFNNAGIDRNIEAFIPGGPISPDQGIADPLKQAAAWSVSPVAEQQIMMINMIMGTMGPGAPGQGASVGQPGTGGPVQNNPPGQPGGDSPGGSPPPQQGEQ